MCIPSSAIRSMNGALHRVSRGRRQGTCPEPFSNRSLAINRRNTALRNIHQRHAGTRVRIHSTDSRRGTEPLGR